MVNSLTFICVYKNSKIGLFFPCFSCRLQFKLNTNKTYVLQLQQAFQEKEDENVRLKHYIDTILLNIVENYPQLLEVKPMERK